MPVVLSRRLFFLPHFRHQFAEKAINLYGSFAFENGFISIPNRRVVVVVPVVVVIIVVFVAFIIANSLSARGECFSSKPRPGEPTSITGACVVVEFLFPLSIHNVIMYTQQQRQKLQSQQRERYGTHAAAAGCCGSPRQMFYGHRTTEEKLPHQTSITTTTG